MYNSNTNRNVEMNKRMVIFIGYRYDSFEEYIQLNYLEMMTKELEDYIKENELNTYNNSVVYAFNLYCIQNIQVLSIKFTKSQIDKVEFDIRLKAEYELADGDEQTGEIHTSVTKKEYFELKMKGSFKEGFKPKEKNEIERLNEEPDEILSSGLVPIIHTEEMDNYATKFLKEFCPEALTTPTKLNIQEMLNKMEIDYYYAPLEDGIFGKTYFAVDKATVYTQTLSKTKNIKVKPGTILLDITKHIERNEGSFRNTVIHECVHWFFHRNYFELRQCLNSEDTYVACYKGENKYAIKDIEWMEWQARTMAPRILMPRKMALQKFNELTKEIDGEQETLGVVRTKAEKWEELLIRFARFFGVSKISAKIRLKEIGKTGIEGVGNYVDGEYTKPFFFKKGSLKKNQTFIISAENLARLLTTNIFVQQALQQEKLLYINKMLVVNNEKYVNYKKYEMTEYALEHTDECCLIFNVTRFGINENGLYDKYSFMFSSPSQRKEIKEVEQEQAVRVIRLADQAASHFESHKNKMPNDFAGTFGYHYDKAKENMVISSFEDLAGESDISDKTIRSYKDGKTVPSRINIIKLGLAMRLSAPYIVDMLEKADCKMTLNNGDNTILFAIIYGFQRVGLERTYIELKKVGKEYLLELSDKYLDNHCLA